MSDEIDPRRFRDVMGRFATGITVVTVAGDGQMRGMTANSFSSVSLDPPLLLVCIDRHASIFSMFEQATVFGVNILRHDQQEVSRAFAEKGEKAQPMGGHAFRAGPLGSPILDGVLAWAECRIEHRYDGGDHVIVVGRVADLEVEEPEAEPLLFYRGQYRTLGPAL